MIFIIILCIILFFLIRFFVNNRPPATGSVSLVTGGIKVGKSTLSVFLVFVKFYTALISVKLYNFFHRKNKLDTPYIYSNIPLKSKYYQPLTEDILYRRVRIPDKSVTYINETSLLADNFDYKDNDKCEKLKLFIKLYGHECNGFLLFDTQSLKDCLYVIKYSLAEYIFIDSKKVGLFGVTFKYRRMICQDGDTVSIVNTVDGKESSFNSCWVPKFIWKKFNFRCYRGFTDNLPLPSYVDQGIKSYSDLVSRDCLSINDKRTSLLLESLSRSKDNKKNNDNGVIKLI